jgi:VanZ family protein
MRFRDMRIRVPLLPAWIRWGAVVGLALFIFYASIVTTPPGTAIDTRPEIVPLDKWRHFLAYAALGNTLAYATTDWETDTRLMATSVIAVTVVYGIGIEFGQSYTPNRFFSIGDAYANALGGILVIPFYLLRSRLEFISVSELLNSRSSED